MDCTKIILDNPVSLLGTVEPVEIFRGKLYLIELFDAGGKHVRDPG
jgi:hypothetical protein